MNDAILEILSKATDYLTAGEIADKGKWKSAGNVGVALKNLGDRVISRKSPARKALNGIPVVEWKHADKQFKGEEKAEPVVAPAPVPAVKAPAYDPKDVAFKPPKTDAEQLLRAALAKAEEENKLLHKSLSDTITNRDAWRLVVWQLSNEDSPSGASVHFSKINAEVARLVAENAALKALNESKQTTVDLPKASAFVVAVPKKPMRKYVLISAAKAAAMASAREGNGGEVFALVPVGKAVRGVAWKDAA